MTKTLINKDRNEYRFEISNEEACKHIFKCIFPTNPELKESDIKRSKFSREFEAHYHRSDGENVSIYVGISNLKRYFGAFILSFTKEGLSFVRQMKWAKKNRIEDEFS